jgi:hypothetical protein
MRTPIDAADGGGAEEGVRNHRGHSRRSVRRSGNASPSEGRWSRATSTAVAPLRARRCPSAAPSAWVSPSSSGAPTGVSRGRPRQHSAIAVLLARHGEHRLHGLPLEDQILHVRHRAANGAKARAGDDQHDAVGLHLDGGEGVRQDVRVDREDLRDRRVKKTLSESSEARGVPKATLRYRLKTMGVTMEEALAMGSPGQRRGRALETTDATPTPFLAPTLPQDFEPATRRGPPWRRQWFTALPRT